MTDQEFATAIRGLRPRQLDALTQVALGNDGHHPKTLGVLVRRGLIEAYKETLSGRFPVVITRHLMPMHVHVAWAAWSATQYPIPDMPSEAGA